jgi:hypothetical protein
MALQDFKCTLEIKDHSVQYASFGIKVIIFWPLEKMPHIQGASDAVLIRNAKVGYLRSALHRTLVLQPPGPNVERWNILTG